MFGPDLTQERPNIPFAPFSKADRLGKIADWTASVDAPKEQRRIVCPPTLLRYDDSSFLLVDRFSKRKLKSKLVTAAKNKSFDKPKARGPSIKIGPTWSLLEELDFTRLTKLHYDIPEPKDLKFTGRLAYCSNDKITSRTAKKLPHLDRQPLNSTASEDETLKSLALSDGPTVITTDTVLAALMCASKSVYSWDLIIVKRGNKLVLDKRNNGPLDVVTLNENASEPPSETLERDAAINFPQALASEATLLNSDYKNAILASNGSVEFDSALPALEQQESKAFRYRQLDFGTCTLFVRCTIDAAASGPSESEILDCKSSSKPLHETCLVKVQALNEIDARAAHSCGAPDWRQKIDSQRGAVMASELKNNSHKLSKWITEAIIADVDQLRLGFVSRASPKDRKNHVIIGQSILKPYDFANQMNLNIYNGWGIARAFIDLCLAQSGDGKFVLVKDPQRQILRLYQASASADLDIIEDEEVAEEESFE